MPKIVQKLSPLKVARETDPGLYADGDGLYLQITSTKAKSWIYRYWSNGRSREMGLGPLRKVSLDEARKKVRECSALRDAGRDPIEARRAEKQERLLEEAQRLKFRDASQSYVAAHRDGWRNAKHAAQWESTLEAYVYPIIGSLPVQAVDTALVLKVLEQEVGIGKLKRDTFWKARPETASRVRGRIESILDWCAVRNYRTGENPARWRGHLKKVLPEKTKVREVKHHAALPYTRVAEFIAAIRTREGTAARALEFAILTAARTSETIGAMVGEVDQHERAWTISATRMKAKRDHRVPLCDRALQIIEETANDTYLFPGAYGRPLSNMAMAALLDRMGFDDITVHGFRSTFKDWTRDCTNFPNDLSEAALAHAIKGKTEAAYARGTMFEKRRKMMNAWAAYCEAPRVQNVLELRRA